MVDELVKLVRRTGEEASLWAYAAWTLPFTALALLVFEHFIGWESLIGKTLVLISVTFFTISVFWWWWALNKLVVLLRYAKDNETRFKEILDEIQETKHAVNNRILEIDNVGDRQRRKS